MSTKNQLAIKLGKVNLTARQHKLLHAAIHEAVVETLKESSAVAAELESIISDTASATLKVDFLGANPGLSKLTARHKGNDQTLTSGGSISFNDVSSGDTISIRGKSLGTTVVTIDRKSNLMSMTFGPGQAIGGIFLILE